ncbi:ABC-three component system protein [Xenorhabdus bovienii]|uniref:ABC-three component system protein n=1 Tax=Xenorhabdus bovienii TaxID=40576 RepID=UPI003DA2405C
MNIFDKTSAEKKSIGFSYQDYVALKHALELKPGEKVGIEVFDDLHLENIHGKKTFIQVKHSIKNLSNVTNKDIDLWKTLYNWSEAIQAINDKDVSLIFYTNKLLTQKSGIVQILSGKTKKIENIQNEIKKILRDYKNKEDDLHNYISTIDKLPTETAKRLFDSITFSHSEDEVTDQIKILLKTLSIPENKIDDAFHNISGAFLEYKYKLVKDNHKIVITYDDFRNKIGTDRIVQISRNCINTFDQYYKFESAYPINLDDKISYRQLQDLNINAKLIIKHINQMAKTEAFIQSLINDGELTKQEEELIYNKVFDEWESNHIVKYITDNYDEICESHISTATSIYLELISKCDISIENNKLPRSMVTGTFLTLSDEPRIGWLQHWESVYK